MRPVPVRANEIESGASLTDVDVLKASSKVNLYLFHSNSCPHCKVERKFLDELDFHYKEKFNLYEFEVGEYQELFKEVSKAIDETSLYVPYLVIGDDAIIGFGDADTTGKEILDRIDFCYENGCSDSVLKIVDPDAAEGQIEGGIEGTEGSLQPVQQNTEKLIKIPFIGQTVNIRSFSLPVVAVLLGFVDGFNPCAMWVLLFLITLLIEVKSFYKRIYLGTLFILASGAVYFAALLGWNLMFTFLHNVFWIKLLVAIIASFSGVNLIKKFFEKDDTCKVVAQDKRQTIFSRLRKVVDANNILYASIMLIVIAFSVNIIELACSLGLPVVFADLLEEHGTSLVEKIGLISIYIFFYMLDDMVIFVISMITLQTTGLGKKYLRFVYLVGGVVMLLIAVNLVFGLS